MNKSGHIWMSCVTSQCGMTVFSMLHALQCTATHCNTMHESWLSLPWYTHCNALQHTAIHCNTLHGPNLKKTALSNFPVVLQLPSHAPILLHIILLAFRLARYFRKQNFVVFYLISFSPGSKTKFCFQKISAKKKYIYISFFAGTYQSVENWNGTVCFHSESRKQERRWWCPFNFFVFLSFHRKFSVKKTRKNSRPMESDRNWESNALLIITIN